MNTRSNASITIRLGAGVDRVTVDGHVFDRMKMKGGDKARLRRMTVAGLEASGYFERKVS